MAAINQLNAVGTLSGSDLLALYSQANGDARKVSISALATFLASLDTAAQDSKVTQYAAPIAASTTLITDSQNSVWLILTPAGALATATLKLPLSTNSVDRQEILVNCTQAVTALTLDANGGTIIGGPTALTANEFFRLRFDVVLQTWYRVG